MSGSGHKTFVDGDVLTAAEVNGYLMDQAVIYYATSTARDLDTPYEGKIVYLADSNKMQFYTGTAWIDVQDTQIFNNKGDLIVGTGADTRLRLEVGSNEQRLVADSGETTGLKYVADTTNYAIGAKGDLLVGTAADTLTNLAVGTNGYVLTADSAETSGLKWAEAAAAGGKVLQVVSTFKDDTFSLASAVFTDVTGLSVSITPSAATSKILVLWIVPTSGAWGAANGQMRVVRDSTAIAIGATAGSRTRVTSEVYPSVQSTYQPLSGNFLDSPATTSALTYKIQIARQGASGTVYVNRSDTDTDSASFSRAAASITVLEIGA